MSASAVVGIPPLFRDLGLEGGLCSWIQERELLIMNIRALDLIPNFFAISQLSSKLETGYVESFLPLCTCLSSVQHIMNACRRFHSKSSNSKRGVSIALEAVQRLAPRQKTIGQGQVLTEFYCKGFPNSCGVALHARTEILLVVGEKDVDSGATARRLCPTSNWKEELAMQE